MSKRVKKQCSIDIEDQEISDPGGNPLFMLIFSDTNLYTSLELTLREMNDLAIKILGKIEVHQQKAEIEREATAIAKEESK